MGVGEIRVSELRQKHLLSEAYKMAIDGIRYYRSENDITKRKMYVYTEKKAVVDPYRANNKIASGFYKLLVDQKVNFILGTYPDVEIPVDDFWYNVRDVANYAAIQGERWTHFYILDGEFKTEQYSRDELLPIYENGELIKMFRFYQDKDGQEWTTEYTDQEQIIYKGEQEVDRRGHMIERVREGAIERTNGRGWGVVPFIPLYNNKDSIYDLESVKQFIDAFDIVLSDFANNLEDFQDVTWILKGYSGDSIEEFINEIKLYKTLVVGEGGDARPETIDIPYEARGAMLEQLEKLIFKFGFGLNLDNLSGGSLTNVNIQSQFANLEMKCNAFAQEVTKYIDRYINAYNLYAELVRKPKIEPQEIIYNKDVMVNQLELAQTQATELQANAGQFNLISEKTRLLNHIWVEDVEEEIKEMEVEGMAGGIDVDIPED